MNLIIFGVGFDKAHCREMSNYPDTVHRGFCRLECFLYESIRGTMSHILLRTQCRNLSYNCQQFLKIYPNSFIICLAVILLLRTVRTVSL